MVDICSWILSPEIREYIRKNKQLSIRERQALICGAYRPIEEKLSALQMLQDEAESEEDQTLLAKLVAVYQLAIQEIRQCRRDEFYLSETALQFGGDSGIRAYPFSYIGELETELCRSYEQITRFDPVEYCPVSSGYSVEKWRRKGEWSVVVRFDQRPIDGRYQVTSFSLCDTKMKQTGLTREDWMNSCDLDAPHPYPLPFSTGDLVYLDAPLFEEPVYGVLCCWDSLQYDGERHILLGYIDHGRFAPMDLSNHDIAFAGTGYRVIDWLHTASSVGLPPEQSVLVEIGTHLRRLNCQNERKAKELFFHIFLRSQNNRTYVPYHVGPAALSELIEEPSKRST